jgi:WD40 repeat protein
MELEKTVPWVTSLAVDPHNDSTLAAAYSTLRGGQLRYWDLATKKERPVPVALDFWDPQSIKFTPDGRHLVCGHHPSDKPSTLFVLDTETWEVKARTDHAARIFDVAISHDGSLMATAGADHTIHLWDTSTWKVVNVLKGHLHEVSSVAFSPDDSLLYSGGKDGAIREWSTSPKKKRDPVLVPFDEDWRTAAMSSDGSAFAVIRRSGLATVWDVLLGKSVAQLELPPVLKTDGHLPFAVSNKGRWLATILEDGSIGMWNVHSENQEHLTVEPLGSANHATIEFSPTEDALFALRPDGQLEKFTLPLAQRTALLPPQSETAKAHSVSFSDDGQRIAIGLDDGSVLAFKFEAGKLISEWDQWKPHYEHVDRVTYLSDGKTVVTCSRDGGIKFWDVGSKLEFKKLNSVRDAFFSMAASPNGKRLVAGTASGQVHLWDVESQRQVLVLEEVGTLPINRIAFPDENTLACVDYKGVGLVVLKVPTWEQIKAEESGERPDEPRPATPADMVAKNYWVRFLRRTLWPPLPNKMRFRPAGNYTAAL